MRELTHELPELSQQLRRRIGKLIPLIKNVNPPVDTAADRNVAFVAIEVLNAWSSFSRSFYLSSALRAHTASGSRVTITATGISTPHDALKLAMLKIKGVKQPFQRRNEPSWHTINNLITLVNALGASNATTVVNALSYPTHVFKCLPTARNFFAHRNADTAGKCRALPATLSIPAVWRPTDILVQRDLSRPNNILTEWISDMTTVADMMVQ